MTIRRRSPGGTAIQIGLDWIWFTTLMGLPGVVLAIGAVRSLSAPRHPTPTPSLAAD